MLFGSGEFWKADHAYFEADAGAVGPPLPPPPPPLPLPFLPSRPPLTPCCGVRPPRPLLSLPPPPPLPWLETLLFRTRPECGLGVSVAADGVTGGGGRVGVDAGGGGVCGTTAVRCCCRCDGGEKGAELGGGPLLLLLPLSPPMAKTFLRNRSCSAAMLPLRGVNCGGGEAVPCCSAWFW